ncbi:MAG: 50S ribosomal protein L11 methyltransferase [Planctomycetes bacterium]|nr:50S ribosomal protein L11 methyltransferase [Planctomycetota bacterium]
MLKLAAVKEGDVVFDLGCGDGRIVVTAVSKFKAKEGWGLDLNPDRIKDSLETAKKANVSDRVKFDQGDVLKVEDVSKANVVTLYLLPEVNRRLAPMLKKTLKPGSRVVSHDFDMGDWKEDKKISVTDEEGVEHTIYLWTIK